MSTSGDKPAQSGLVDMGDIAFYNHSTDHIPSSFAATLADLTNFSGQFSEVVLNVTWAQLQPDQGGQIDPSGLIATAIGEAESHHVGIKLRVWGGYAAPDWAKNIDGPPITITGPGTVDPSDSNPETIGRFWTADYIDAWTSFQTGLAALYDSNPVILGISNTAGASATDEPFVPLKIFPSVANQPGELVAGGYTDAAQMLTLRAGIADYAQWSTTPLDFTMNLFHLYDSGKDTGDANFTLAVLQQAQNSTRLVQAGNHALNSPLPSADAFVYAQITAAALLDPALAASSFQTASPTNLANQPVGFNFPNFTGAYADWPYAVVNGVAANTGDIELWDGPGKTGFTGLSSSQAQFLATLVAAGIAPTTGAPDDGSALQFIAPAFAIAATSTIAFSGVDAVLLASATAQTSYSVTLTSTQGGTLAVNDVFGIVNGPTSGPTLRLSGSLAQVNTVLASLTDTLQTGTDVVRIVATDSSGDQAVRTVGAQVSAAATPSGGGTQAAGPSAFQSDGILVVGGVQGSLVIPGNLQIGTADSSTTLLAALAPAAYSTANLAVGGTLEVQAGGVAHFSGSLGATTVSVDSGGAISGDGTLAASGGAPIVNGGTIEAAADQTLGLQQLTVANALSGTGTLLIDPGATLTLARAVGPDQTILFAPNSIAQFADDPYSPGTLVLGAPAGMKGTVTGFTFADTLLLQGVAATAVSYDASTEMLTVGPSQSFKLTGDLAGLTFNAQGSGSDTIVTFVAPAAGLAPSVAAPTTLEGAAGTAVSVPGIVINTPLPSTPPSDMTVTVALTAGTGTLFANDDNGNTFITGVGSSITLSGTLGAVERSLQSLTYTAATGQPSDSITVTVSDYAGASVAPAVITVSNNSPSPQFTWAAAGGGSFGDRTNWTTQGGASAPPGGANVAKFGSGTYTVSGDGAVGEIIATGAATLTGQVIAQGVSQGAGTVALTVDSGGALTLAGGAQVTAQAQATVGDPAGQGLLTVMGGALALTGTSGPDLVVGEGPGGIGTVVNLEQITAAGTVVIGEKGTGTLDLQGVASTLLDGGAVIGQSVGGQGTATVNGGEWMTSGTLTVGDQGSGTLLVNGADNGITGQVTAFNATIGSQSGSTGSVTLDGSDLLVADATAQSSTLTVGGAGSGSLVVEDGSNVTVGAAEATTGSHSNPIIVDNNGLLNVGGNAGGTGVARIGRNGELLVYGMAMVGAAAGIGKITVGESADDTALFATTGTLTVDGNGQVILDGANATVRAGALDVAAGGVVSGAGTLTGLLGGNDTVTLAGLSNDGTIGASGGSLLIYGEVTGTGELTVGSGATMTLQAAVSGGEKLVFSSNAKTMLNDPRAFSGTITGFAAGDLLELASTQATSATWSNGVLTLDGDPFGPIRLNMAGDYAPNFFTVQSDGLGGTIVAGGNGDVHMTTFEGVHYDFQAVGEFVAVRSTDAHNPWQIQIRTESFPGETSVTTAIAAEFGDERVSFDIDRANPVSVQNLGGGALKALSANAWQLTSSAGESLTVIDRGGFLDWSVGLSPQDGAGSVEGLLGRHAGRPNDFQMPNANDWVVAPGASLLGDPTAALSQAIAAELAPDGIVSHDRGAMAQESPSAASLIAPPTPHSALHP
ncbi:MAG: hypothetical protein JOY64_16155 [Alphaproteobacteria bacterium]|nr:hypothetical protein [Alphaproteobacteria bacterium]